jgi:hypothetical protein
MRAFRREALQQLSLSSPGMELNMEMLIKIGRCGMTVDQVPIGLKRRVGKSKLRTIPDGWRNLRYLLAATPALLPHEAPVALTDSSPQTAATAQQSAL